ncbi:D-alanyl-D-alanine carboxypeptidase DacC precursor [Marinobacterium sp. xm-a-121]|jgi:D-alanyl-D-alanine carboxypeptidase (penicillin-binding protein 5/6)|uniref:D-alanyl-D-alanine carboxypeptidase family protein n=1 Tax=unclassified Marinobacterium TaxID=2644139 RepID=UPI001567D5B4|nr:MULTISPECIES: D-alanyl-D-alanine carboxypeptidase family protein [unclassified Marinobacterium]NRP39580.1 D-alanyl-D-alanine carboxypeptidase DacC precursor [Marinobacterium sp. xm-a-121]NRP47733.1 D-alanyl-D-alanine carboxypeptidase DacC precursor [Marinobacterium sp. xm-d-543]NRQ00524.1 D-alanyl-D-alanine carboxypeptidase DacC precursor [Marinobacterium sp. xm-v-233]NRQ23972.1 D-alanyl-D-alanine carboxypeptidase DacC precursor [Marinobacterium sp. xm-m-312]
MLSKIRFLVLLFVAVATVQIQAAVLPPPPQLAATAYVLMDASTGDIIAESGADGQFAPASLTKMMTSYIVEHEVSEGNISFNDLVPISVKAWKTEGSRMFVREGTQVRLEDLLRGVIIQSGNDASVALAEYVAGSEEAFADLMNQHAERLGLTNTHFKNATGLPAEGHYSSPRDLALIGRALIQDFPEQYAIYKEKYFTYNDIKQPNRNRLLWRDPTVDGIKTGHTEEAGYCLVSSAVRDDMRLISVVLGTTSDQARAQESQKLLAYGFRFFRNYPLYKAGQELNKPKVWKGVTDSVSLGLGGDLSLTIPRGSENQLAATLDLPEVIEAPLAAGEVVGHLLVTLEGEEVAREPLLALQSVEEAGFVKAIWHSIVLFFQGLFG